jgi:hypothetical protein
MNNTIHFESVTSIKDTLIPFLEEHLSTSGWALVKIEPSVKTESDMLIIATLAGQALGESFGYHNLNATDSDETLAVHTEGISNEGGIIPYFALGCIKPADSGGETRLFDGRIAAREIDNTPELSDVIIEYSALANPNARVSYPLVIPEYGRTLRYRSNVETNLVLSSDKIPENKMYKKVDEVIEKSLIVSHRWSAGELIFVNNLFTLHDRLPFQGNRIMLRVRYNDTLNSRIRY